MKLLVPATGLQAESAQLTHGDEMVQAMATMRHPDFPVGGDADAGSEWLNTHGGSVDDLVLAALAALEYERAPWLADNLDRHGRLTRDAYRLIPRLFLQSAVEPSVQAVGRAC